MRLMDHLGVARAHVVGYSLGGMIAMRVLTDHPDRVLSGTLAGMGLFREGSPLQEFWGRIPARPGGRTAAACMRAVGALAVTEDAVRAIRAPVEVIVGDRDPVRRLYVTPLAVVRPDWRIVELEDAGHLNAIMKPAFRSEIRGWLDRQAGDRPRSP